MGRHNSQSFQIAAAQPSSAHFKKVLRGAVKFISAKSLAAAPVKKLLFALMLLWAAGLFAQAAAPSAFADSFELNYSKALSLISEQKFDEALVLLTAIDPAAHKSAMPQVYYQIAYCHAAKGSLEKSIYYADQSITADYTFDRPYVLKYEILSNAGRFEEAAYALHNLAEIKPESYEYWYTLGIMYANQLKNYKMAIFCFTTILNYEGKESIPMQFIENSALILADLYLYTEEYDKAIASMNRAAQINQENTMKFYRLANFFISKNMLKEAVDTVQFFLNNLSEEQKRSDYIYKIYAFLGRMYYVQGRSDAITFVRLGSQDTTDDGAVCKALFLELTGRGAEAKATLEELVKKLPSYVSPYVALAKILEKEGDPAGAYDYYITGALILSKSNYDAATLAVLKRAAAIKPEIARAHQMLGVLYERQESPVTAIYHYRKSDPDEKNQELLLHVAVLAHQAKNSKLAREMLTKSYAIDSENPRVWFTDAVLAANAGDHKKALTLYDKAISLDAESAETFYYKAISVEKVSGRLATVDTLKRAVTLDGENPVYLNYLGYVYADTNSNLDEAERLLLKVLEISPNNGAYLDSLGWVYFRRGEYRKAEPYLISAYRNLLAEGQHDYEVYDHLGDNYSKLERFDLALRFYKIAHENAPDSDKLLIGKKIAALQK